MVAVAVSRGGLVEVPTEAGVAGGPRRGMS